MLIKKQLINLADIENYIKMDPFTKENEIKYMQSSIIPIYILYSFISPHEFPVFNFIGSGTDNCKEFSIFFFITLATFFKYFEGTSYISSSCRWRTNIGLFFVLQNISCNSCSILTIAAFTMSAADPCMIVFTAWRSAWSETCYMLI